MAESDGSSPPIPPITIVKTIPTARVLASTTSLSSTLLPPPEPLLTMLEASQPSASEPRAQPQYASVK